MSATVTEQGSVKLVNPVAENSGVKQFHNPLNDESEDDEVAEQVQVPVEDTKQL